MWITSEQGTALVLSVMTGNKRLTRTFSGLLNNWLFYIILGVTVQTWPRLGNYRALHSSSRDFVERHAGVDRRSTLGLRVDGKLPVHQLQPLRHTDEAKPAGFHCFLNVKTESRIAHGEVDHIRRVAQFYIEAPHAAVLNGILQGFLLYAEKAK